MSTMTMETATLDRVQPRTTHAVAPRTAYATAPARPGAASLAETLSLRILDELDYGLMVVTELGKVCLANNLALRECAASGAIQLRNGHVLPRQPHQQEPFLKALAAARSGRRTLMTLQGEQPPVSLALVPVTDVVAPGPDAPAMLLVFGKRRVCEPLSVELYARAHNLTGAETTVLIELCNGLRPNQIAQHCGVALSTVRTQICSIRHKTGAASIGELVRMMIGLPPIIPALSRMNLAGDMLAA
jgi:DNA-binding CsgD family transcriptional regulator